MRKSPKKTGEYHTKVILLQSSEWKFWDCTLGDKNLIEEWLSGLSDQARGTFHSLLKNNRKVREPINWTGLKFLNGEAKKHRLWELVFYSDKRQYRVFGFFGDERMQATLLIGCFHKQRVYQPANAIHTAITRKRQLEEGVATHRERKIPDDI